jgi:histidinol dehydrogenase
VIVNPNVMKLISSGDTRAVNRLLARDEALDPTLARRVAAIVADVRRGGDRALIAYARKFDKLEGAIEITRDEI